MSYTEPNCNSCNIPIMSSGEYFMLRDSLWNLVIILRFIKEKKKTEFLCVDCIEKVLERKLDKYDFSTCQLNLVSDDSRIRSETLKNRLDIPSEEYKIRVRRTTEEIIGYQTIYNNMCK